MSVTTGTGALSEREKQVLALIARGRTNPEIAAELGIRFETAKWHVSEIITKLGVDSREEAAEAWRADRTIGRRVARGFQAVVAPIIAHKLVIAAATGVVVAVAAGSLVIGILRSGGPSTRGLPSSPTLGQLIAQPFFKQMRMIDGSVGWARSQASDGNDFSIIRTNDGGRSWHDVSPAFDSNDTVRIRASFFLDGAHAWALVEHRSAAKPIELRTAWTTDGGRSWQEGESVGALTFVAPQLTFVDREHGWLLDTVGTGAVFRTTDGGGHWQKVSVSPGGTAGSVCGSSGLVFITPKVGFAAGVCTEGPPLLFRTDDGGATWHRQVLPAPGSSQQPVSDQARIESLPQFPDTNDGFLVLWQPTTGGNTTAASDGLLPTVYATHDSGKTWQVAAQPGVTALSGALTFVDPMHGWLTDSSAHLFRSSDGGRSWEQLPDGNGIFGLLRFTSITEGWAVSPTSSQTGPPVLIHTTDGGETWQPVNP